MNEQLHPLTRYWQPRYWPIWLAIALMRLIVFLPQRARMWCGRLLGRIAHRFTASRRDVVARNLELCFPDMQAAERADLNRRHFESLGMAAVELCMAWWCSDAEINELVELRGTEYLLEALEEGHGVLMLSGHFVAAELTGRKLKQLVPPMAAMYRESRNPLTDQIIRRCRLNSAAEMITKNNVRKMLRVLKQNRAFWYAADQAYNGKGMVMADFFGIPATANAAATQIIRVSKARIVPFFPRRLDNGRSYELVFLPPMENFPGESAEADAQHINKLLEDQIRQAPEQYYWVHRRFKGRPDEYPELYS